MTITTIVTFIIILVAKKESSIIKIGVNGVHLTLKESYSDLDVIKKIQAY